MPWCATGGLDGGAVVWDVATAKVRAQRAALQARAHPSRTHTAEQSRQVFLHDDAVVRIAWHPVQPLLFTACLDRKLRLWDARSGECVKEWEGHSVGGAPPRARAGSARS